MLPRLLAQATALKTLPSTSTSPPPLAALIKGNGTITQRTTSVSTSSTLHLRRPRPRWLSSGPFKGEQEAPPRKKQPSFSFSGA